MWTKTAMFECFWRCNYSLFNWKHDRQLFLMMNQACFPKLCSDTQPFNEHLDSPKNITAAAQLFFSLVPLGNTYRDK